MSKTLDMPTKTDPAIGSDRIVASDPGMELDALAKKHPQEIPYLKAAFRNIAANNGMCGFVVHGSLHGKVMADFDIGNVRLQDVNVDIKNVLRECLVDCKMERQPVITTKRLQNQNQKLSVFALPLAPIANDEFDGFIAFSYLSNATTDVQHKITQLRCELILALSYMPIVTSTRVESKPESPSLENDFIATGNLGKVGSTREFAFKLVHEFVRKFDCQQVALGISRLNSAEVYAVSGVEFIKSSNPGIVDIQQAMDESRDCQQIVVHQPSRKLNAYRSLPIHESWARKSKSAVCSIPLMAGQECVGVVSLTREPEIGFKESDIEAIRQTVEAFGPALEMSLRGDRTLRRHIVEKGYGMMAPGSLSGKFIRLLIACGVLFFCFGKIPYRPATVCELVPAEVSQTTAPFDAKLLSCPVKSGQSVVKGELLALFDSKQLELERESLKAKIEQLEIDVRRYLQEGDVAAAHHAKSNSLSLKHDLSLVNTKIDLCSVIAPQNGIVVDADLEQKIGQVFSQGEQVLTFSPMKNWELQLQVPESLARELKPGLSGTFCLNGWPGKSFPYQISYLSGDAELVDGQNIFLARANVQTPSEFFRQGMEGIAKTDTDWQRISWLTFRGAYEYLYQNFWF